MQKGITIDSTTYARDGAIYNGHHKETELRRVVAVGPDSTVVLDMPLLYDHDGAPLAMISRSITLRSDLAAVAAGGARGHVMASGGCA
jgi:hypothetical protein